MGNLAKCLIQCESLQQWTQSQEHDNVGRNKIHCWQCKQMDYYKVVCNRVVIIKTVEWIIFRQNNGEFYNFKTKIVILVSF